MYKNIYAAFFCLSTLIASTIQTEETYRIQSSSASQETPIDATVSSFARSTTRASKNKDITDADPKQNKAITADEPAPAESKKWYDFLNPKKKKTLRNMTFDELEEYKNSCLAKNDRYTAIKALEKMVPLCSDLEKLRTILMELADLFFEDEKYESAFRMYQEFVRYYPGSNQVEYASYKAILCRYYSICDAEHDQTNTKETLELTRSFLERKQIFKTYAQDVRAIEDTCYQRLIDSELEAYTFYVKNKRYTSAKTRLANIKKEYIDRMPTIEPYLLSLEIDLYTETKNTEKIEELTTTLREKFPTYTRDTQVAHAQKKKHSADRF